MHSDHDPKDGRRLEESIQRSFFSMHVRLPGPADLAAIAFIATGCAIFFNSFINGSHGLLAERNFIQERDLLKGQSVALDRNIQRQTNLNRRLSDQYLDLDLLEERARVLLGYVHTRDILTDP